MAKFAVKAYKQTPMDDGRKLVRKILLVTGSIPPTKDVLEDILSLKGSRTRKKDIVAHAASKLISYCDHDRGQHWRKDQARAAAALIRDYENTNYFLVDYETIKPPEGPKVEYRVTFFSTEEELDEHLRTIMVEGAHLYRSWM